MVRHTLVATGILVLVVAAAGCSGGSSDPGEQTRGLEPDEVFLITLGYAPGVVERNDETEVIEAAKASCRAGTDAGEGADTTQVMIQSLQDSGVTESPVEAALVSGAAIAAYCPEHGRSP